MRIDSNEFLIATGNDHIPSMCCYTHAWHTYVQCNDDCVKRVHYVVHLPTDCLLSSVLIEQSVRVCVYIYIICV